MSGISISSTATCKAYLKFINWHGRQIGERTDIFPLNPTPSLDYTCCLVFDTVVTERRNENNLLALIQSSQPHNPTCHQNTLLTFHQSIAVAEVGWKFPNGLNVTALYIGIPDGRTITPKTGTTAETRLTAAPFILTAVPSPMDNEWLALDQRLTKPWNAKSWEYLQVCPCVQLPSISLDLYLSRCFRFTLF